ncbi:hypothetical protein BJ944DRAFT_238194 [Cunninghamella echinulata]|nr:hypothetical protein BJ944DRAFT_238194 [Cunninghamella echinulata]
MKNYTLFLFVLGLIAYVQACYYEVNYVTSAGRTHYIANYSCSRYCVCVKNVNTYQIYSGVSGVTRLFSSTDCTGNYQTINGNIKNGEWVNSISFGPLGVSNTPNSSCYYEVNYRTSAGKMYYIPNYSCERVCHCLKNVNTHKIYPATTAGVFRLFSTTDCTGNYQTMTAMVDNAEWVNSVSFGPSGTSVGPWGCPSTYPD